MAAGVIAFSVQNGSGGYSIARRVAERLGFRYYDWEITSEAARRAGVSPNDVIAAERVPSFLERMMQRLSAISTLSAEGATAFPDPSPAVWNTAIQSLTSEDYRQLIERVVVELADQGQAVIVGHASQFTLRERADVLKVLIHGSLCRRAQRFAMEQGIELAKAEAIVKQSDKDRRDLLKTVYHFDWQDAGVYDLSINTDRLTDEFAIETVVSAARQL
ncbi:MAG TPA: cytidylate kinase-like family protein [Dehalococcoidia bacterium]|nr:cytidylate kinase-like family protein [Dehalococcoidia bacterium]